MENAEGKLTHLPHAEDHMIEDGESGFNHSVHVLDSVHDSLLGKKTSIKINTKFDGSPSLVFGYHPQNGKFFVASKSAFNKNPKLNYSNEDISRNHSKAEGLQSKLRDALEHLPKVTPKKGVFQGDFMYSKNEVNSDKRAFHFKPNTLTYSTPKDSEEGKKIANAKMGLVVHTHYKGKNLEDMIAHFDPKHEDFKQHPDVHLITPETNTSSSNYTTEAQHGYLKSMQQAVNLHNKIPSHAHEAFSRAKDHTILHINSAVREGKKPTTNGLINHLKSSYGKEIEGLKTEKGKEGRRQILKAHLNNINSHKQHFDNLFAVHGHIQNAKNKLVDALSSGGKFGHSIDGKMAKPEGFVVSYKGRPTKLVDRNEFSRANFAMSQNRKIK
jgi:hypothetical protein